MSTNGYFYIVGQNYDSSKEDQFEFEIEEYGQFESRVHNAYALYEKVAELTKYNKKEYDYMTVEITPTVAEELMLLIVKGDPCIASCDSNNLALTCKAVFKAYREGFKVFFRTC